DLPEAVEQRRDEPLEVLRREGQHAVRDLAVAALPPLLDRASRPGVELVEQHLEAARDRGELRLHPHTGQISSSTRRSDSRSTGFDSTACKPGLVARSVARASAERTMTGIDASAGSAS